jgi:uncharacterized protein (DUF302 family)
MENQNVDHKSTSKKWVWITGLLGVVVGFLACLILVVAILPSQMIITQESRFDLAETVSRLEQSAKQNGWNVQSVWDVNQALAKKGKTLDARVQILKLCQPDYAQEILTTDRYVSCLMPCSIAVWEDDNGKVYFSKMNVGLLGKLFGGNIARIMGQKVSQDEEKIIAGLSGGK